MNEPMMKQRRSLTRAEIDAHLIVAADRRESGGRVCGVLADIWFKPQRRYVKILWLIPFRAWWLKAWVGWELREHARQIIEKTAQVSPNLSPDPEAMQLSKQL